MKLKNRIIVGFMMVILVPLLLFAAALFGISETQHRNAANSESAQETSYDITISDTGSSQARIQIMTKDLFFTAFIILIFTGVSVGLWIYRSVAAPLVKLRKATQNIKEGNLDFVLDVEGTDEFSELCRDFEEMRRRLKESAEEKIAMDKENKELISNISHDLKTPITAVKGYVEGIMDGVADTPEKMDRYVRTIYNKTNEMDHLINELTFYSKIDTNRIPYTFSKLNVEDYFSDCAEEVGLELETRGIQLCYANYVDKDVLVIADGEQIRRVIHNIISNAIKYMDKQNGMKGIIQIRVKDVGDFVHNVVVGSDGVITGAQGGHPDTAAGAKCTIVIAPLLQGRIPAICSEVTTVTTPGESIDVVITDYGIAINPRRQDLIEAMKGVDLPFKTIEELRDIAYSIVGEPEKVQFGDRVVGIIEARDGTIMDVVRQIKPYEFAD